MARPRPLAILAVTLLASCASGESTDVAPQDSAVSTDAVPDADAVVDARDSGSLFETDGICGDGTLQAGEACDDSNTKDGDGCSSTCHIEGCAGDRVAFKDWKTYPNIAVCGPSVDYVTARDSASTVCGAGFHMCALVPAEIATALGGKGKPSETFRAWIKYDDPACNQQAIFSAVACGGSLLATSSFQQTGGCEPSGSCSEGYRATIGDDSWDWSLRSGGVGGTCNDHVAYRCGYAGGSIPVAPSATACCR